MVDINRTTRDEAEEDRGRFTESVHGSKRTEQRTGGVEELLPGIPDDITIGQIAPKLPWTAFHILSAVSRRWQLAICSRQIYDARVRSGSTEKLLVFDQQPFMEINVLTLYSLKDGSFHHLPPLPAPAGETDREYECISLDGKIYILGGFGDDTNTHQYSCADVYVLDLAGQKRWKQCASMGDARARFGCGVQDGKIYVFGGISEGPTVRGSEVYDPEADAWSSISLVPSSRYRHKVTTLGEELFLHDGKIYDSNYVKWLYTRGRPPPFDMIHKDRQDALSAVVYHPVKDEWRIVEHFIEGCWDVVLTVGGKFQKLNELGIQEYDSRANSWSSLRPYSFGIHELSPPYKVYPAAAVAIDGEVLALVHWRCKEFEDTPRELCFIRSIGVGGENEEILWEKIPCSLSFEDDLFMCSIHL